MRKKLIVLTSVIIIGLGIGLVKQNFNATTANSKSQTITNTEFTTLKLTGLSDLKNRTETIVKIIGTDKYKTIDYKGAPFIITTVKIVDVIKGDKKLNEINIIQHDGDVTPKNGETLLMFLRKGVDNPDCYIPIGLGQGIYKVVPAKSNTKSSVDSLISTSDSMILEPQSIVNDDILKDLNGSYKDVRNRLAQ
ncbi:MAG: hypothetical protein H7Y18_00205 [Clostridiaceae bacterium]|nr:hypothetical protein [Clostridiaceae bacterium]